MPERSETTQRKLTLSTDLRNAQSGGGSAFGDGALSQRELGARYGLSGRTVSLLLQQLVEEGVLYTVPRVGTFLGHAPQEAAAPFVFVTPIERCYNSYADLMFTGFEERIAQLGGISLGLTMDEFSWHLEQTHFESLSGAFLFEVPTQFAEELFRQIKTPAVCFGDEDLAVLPHETVDRVDYDNEEGGVEATRHLLSMGHRNIAFLALHGRDQDHGDFRWSVEREAGWRTMMLRAGQNPEPLAFHPALTGGKQLDEQEEAGREAAVKLVGSREITAVIAANVFAAQGLLQALRDAEVPADKWPAIVCFDSAPDGQASGISYVRLTWEKAGAEAAQLLWDRQNGRLQGAACRRLVKMQLIPRLTCRTDWAASGLAHGQTVRKKVRSEGKKPVKSKAVLEPVA